MNYRLLSACTLATACIQASTVTEAHSGCVLLPSFALQSAQPAKCVQNCSLPLGPYSCSRNLPVSHIKDYKSSHMGYEDDEFILQQSMNLDGRIEPVTLSPISTLKGKHSYRTEWEISNKKLMTQDDNFASLLKCSVNCRLSYSYCTSSVAIHHQSHATPRLSKPRKWNAISSR